MCRQEMCSQVVRFAKIRKLWNESKQATLAAGTKFPVAIRREVPG